jgi:hypothetical protein
MTATDEAMMALALSDAEASEDVERIIGAQNAALRMLDVPLDWTEQGIDWRASAVLDALIARRIK